MVYLVIVGVLSALVFVRIVVAMVKNWQDWYFVKILLFGMFLHFVWTFIIVRYVYVNQVASPANCQLDPYCSSGTNTLLLFAIVLLYITGYTFYYLKSYSGFHRRGEEILSPWDRAYNKNKSTVNIESQKEEDFLIDKSAYEIDIEDYESKE